jgi:hypothetical protein
LPQEKFTLASWAGLQLPIQIYAGVKQGIHGREEAKSGASLRMIWVTITGRRKNRKPAACGAGAAGDAHSDYFGII